MDKIKADKDQVDAGAMWQWQHASLIDKMHPHLTF